MKIKFILLLLLILPTYSLLEHNVILQSTTNTFQAKNLTEAYWSTGDPVE